MMLLCLGKKTTSAATIGSIPFISITQKKKKYAETKIKQCKIAVWILF